MSVSPLNKPHSSSECSHNHESADLITRPRRLRQSGEHAPLGTENHLHTDDFIYPIFCG